VPDVQVGVDQVVVTPADDDFFSHGLSNKEV
jgi:hypothetical protein